MLSDRPALLRADGSSSLPLLSRGAWGALALFLVLVTVRGLSDPPLPSMEQLVVAGANTASECISEGTWTSCGHGEGSRWSDVGPFALLQYLPAFILVKAGLSDAGVVRGLQAINAIAFLGSAGLVAHLARRAFGPGWSFIMLVVIVTGYWLFYAFQGFAESLSAAAVVAFAYALLLRKSLWLIAITLVVASLGKETFLPFLILLGLVCGRSEDDGVLPDRRVILGLAIGAAGAVIMTAGFNLFRFGSFTNVFYADPIYRVGNLGVRAKFAVALWFSPNGGLFWFWTSISMLLGLFVIVAIVETLRHRREPRLWIPSSIVILLLLAETAGHASWFAPFGWQAWGPRLSLPLTPGLALAAVYVGGTRLHGVLARALGRVWVLVAVSVVLVVSALPQIAAVWNPYAQLEIQGLDERCPRPASIIEDAGYYYDCINHGAWRTSHLAVGEALTTPIPIQGRIAQAALLLGVVLSLIAARRSCGAQNFKTAPQPSLWRKPEKASALSMTSGGVSAERWIEPESR